MDSNASHVHDYLEVLPPDAQLMASMRAIGYSFKTAIADLVDNSIAAFANSVSIHLDGSKGDYLWVLDNGNGMSKEELRVAMKLAGRSVSYARSATDLGRFGLGLKTASLSQAKRLTVVTYYNEHMLAADWDIDRVLETGQWTLRWLSDSDIAQVPGSNNLKLQGKGTLVVWQKLDVFFDEVSDVERHVAQSLEILANHLSLVFHRYLARKANRLSISVNAKSLSPFDPFLDSNLQGVQVQPEQTFQVAGSTIKIKPYILPQISKMSKKQRELALFEGTARESQGFYVYRADRLLAWGSWFKLTGRSETSKLARIKVDTSSALDSQWKLGIMKSEVSPPPSLVKALKTLVDKFVDTAREVDRGKSKAIASDENSAWTMRSNSDDSFSLEINRENILLREFSNTLDPRQVRQLDAVLTSLEKHFPVQALHHRLANDDSFKEIGNDDADLQNYFNKLCEAFLPLDQDPTDFFEMLASLEPFSTNAKALAFLAKKQTELESQ